MIKVARPLVTVVIPTYNHAQYLRRALSSVVNQTYVNWEAIVIDNHSTDNTDEVMENFIRPNIVYLKIHNNGVIAVSRNAGIREARGDWIAFLDSDDWWENNKLSESVKYIQLGNDIVYHPLKIVNKSNNIFIPKSTSTMGFDKDIYSNLIEFGNFIPNSSVVVKKHFL